MPGIRQNDQKHRGCTKNSLILLRKLIVVQYPSPGIKSFSIQAVHHVPPIYFSCNNGMHFAAVLSKKLMNWIQLTAEGQLEEINRDSFEKPIVLFKHSTRCGISAMAKNRLESKWDFNPSDLPAYYLDLLNFRSLSDRIAQEYKVQHESPQLLLIKNGKCVYNSSHSAISVSALKEAISS